MLERKHRVLMWLAVTPFNTKQIGGNGSGLVAGGGNNAPNLTSQKKIEEK